MHSTGRTRFGQTPYPVGPRMRTMGPSRRHQTGAPRGRSSGHMTDAPSPAPAPAAPAASSGEFVYADVPNRAIAYIIDSIVLVITLVVVGLVLAVVGVVAGSFVGATAMLVIGLVVSAVYFIYTWTRMRATFGMQALGMQI